MNMRPTLRAIICAKSRVRLLTGHIAFSLSENERNVMSHPGRNKKGLKIFSSAPF